MTAIAYDKRLLTSRHRELSSEIDGLEGVNSGRSTTVQNTLIMDDVLNLIVR